MVLDKARAVLVQGEGKELGADDGVTEGVLHGGWNGVLGASRVLLRSDERGNAKGLR